MTHFGDTFVTLLHLVDCTVDLFSSSHVSELHAAWTDQFLMCVLGVIATRFTRTRFELLMFGCEWCPRFSKRFVGVNRRTVQGNGSFILPQKQRFMNFKSSSLTSCVGNLFVPIVLWSGYLLGKISCDQKCVTYSPR